MTPPKNEHRILSLVGIGHVRPEKESLPGSFANDLYYLKTYQSALTVRNRITSQSR
jgi:hypothetical protein